MTHSGEALPRRMHAGEWKRRATDPLEVCIAVIAAMFGLAIIAFASTVWVPLGYAAALIVLWKSLNLLARVREQFIGIKPGRIDVPRYIGVLLIAVLCSIPVTQVFLRGDLSAMASPYIGAQEAGQPDQVPGIPARIYGESTDTPSYQLCQVIQRHVGADSAASCYSGIGYLRLWQMPVALSTMLCILLLYVGFPFAVAWHLQTRHSRTSTASQLFRRKSQ
jgi:hypothetical protein